MGANAVTSIPDFVALQVLTAAELDVVNCGIPVFATDVTRDAAFGGSGEKTLAQGQFCYLESTGKLLVYSGSSWLSVGTQTKVEAFTASGTFTPPAGVTYAIAHIRGGGGAMSQSGATSGGNSSVAFVSGTVTANGGEFVNLFPAAPGGSSGADNSGLAARGGAVWTAASYTSFGADTAGDGAEIVAGADVTAGVGITVTVGAGGTGTLAGGSGFVYITYEV
jgi:hypothetical protein